MILIESLSIWSCTVLKSAQDQPEESEPEIANRQWSWSLSGCWDTNLWKVSGKNRYYIITRRRTPWFFDKFLAFGVSWSTMVCRTQLLYRYIIGSTCFNVFVFFVFLCVFLFFLVNLCLQEKLMFLDQVFSNTGIRQQWRRPPDESEIHLWFLALQVYPAGN